MRILTIKVKDGNRKIHKLSLKEDGGIIQLVNINGKIYLPLLGNRWIKVEVIEAKLK